MGRHTKKDVLEVSMEEIAGIRKAIGETDLSERYKAILLTLIEEVVNIKKTASEKAAALERLRRMFGNSSEKRTRADSSETAKPVDGQAKTEAAEKQPKKAKNHGRIGAKDYSFSKLLIISTKSCMPANVALTADTAHFRNANPAKSYV